MNNNTSDLEFLADSAFAGTYACVKMFCGVTFESEFLDLIATSYVKKHHVGIAKSIISRGVAIFGSV